MKSIEDQNQEKLNAKKMKVAKVKVKSQKKFVDELSF